MNLALIIGIAEICGQALKIVNHIIEKSEKEKEKSKSLELDNLTDNCNNIISNYKELKDEAPELADEIEQESRYAKLPRSNKTAIEQLQQISDDLSKAAYKLQYDEEDIDGKSVNVNKELVEKTLTNMRNRINNMIEDLENKNSQSQDKSFDLFTLD